MKSGKFLKNYPMANILLVIEKSRVRQKGLENLDRFFQREF